jgi:PKD repeat protein
MKSPVLRVVRFGTTSVCSTALGALLFALLVLAGGSGTGATAHAAPQLTAQRAQVGNDVSVTLYPGLSWTDLGTTSEEVPSSQSDVPIPGRMYQSETYTRHIPVYIFGYFADELARSGWEETDAADSRTVESVTYHQASGYFLHISQHIATAKSDPTLTEFYWQVWLSDQTSADPPRRPTPLLSAPLTPVPTSSVPSLKTLTPARTAVGEIPLTLAVPTWSQNDTTYGGTGWKNHQLGWGSCTSVTIGTDGCFVTSYAMLYDWYAGTSYTNPLDLNNRLTTGPIYFAQGNPGCYNWMPGGAPYAPNGLVRQPNIGNTCGSNCIDSGNISTVDGELAANRPVIVYGHGSGYYHMLVLTGHSGSTWYVNDPNDGSNWRNLGNTTLGAFTVTEIRRFVPSTGGTPTNTPTRTNTNTPTRTPTSPPNATNTYTRTPTPNPSGAWTLTNPSYNVAPNQQVQVSVQLHSNTYTFLTTNSILDSLDAQRYGAYQFQPLGSNVSPGQTYTFNRADMFMMTSPSQPGTYTVRWQMKVGGNFMGPISTVTLIVGQGSPTPTAVPPGTWRVQAYPNQSLSGSPCYDANETIGSYVFKDWDWSRSPGGSCPAEHWSVRLTKQVSFSGGDYSFHCTHDDGCRVYIDGNLRIDAWWDGTGGHDWGGNISGGNHEVKVEFYNNTGLGRVEVWWRGPGALPNNDSGDPNQWYVDYYGIRAIWETSVIGLRDGTGFPSHDWRGQGNSPGFGLPAQNWAARFSRTVALPCGTYRFTATADDGVRLEVNGVALFDFGGGPPGTRSADVNIAGGNVPITLFYYQAGGDAYVSMSWQILSACPTATPVPELPTADFDAWPQSGDAPLTVSMHNMSTGNITSCSWNYGDSTTGTSCAAYHDHVYTAAGSYTVSLTVTGPGGSNTKTRTGYINVTVPVPVTVNRVTVRDEAGNDQNIFNPGDTIVLGIEATNGTSATQASTWNWDTYDAANNRIADLSYANWQYNMPPGGMGAGITRSIPWTLADGTYKFVGSVQIGEYTDRIQVTFIVNGPTPTPTSIPTNTPTNTSTWTSTNTPTNTSTRTSTGTPAPPTGTRTSTSTPTRTGTGTPPPPTATQPPGTNMPTSTPTRTGTGTPPPPTATQPPSTCTIQFTDVPVDSTFYPYVRCLACRGIDTGYGCGGVGEPCNSNDEPYFRVNTLINRDDLAHMVAASAGFSEDPGQRRFEDVPPSNPYYVWVQRMANRGLIGGYPCGTQTNEPCVAPDNRAYYRPSANATRGQIAKIVSNGAGYNEPPAGQLFEDVPPTQTFYEWVQRLANRGVMGGYPCGTNEFEPCGPEERPYFRWGNNATRGQVAKITANTFFPNCQTLTQR